MISSNNNNNLNNNHSEIKSSKPTTKNNFVGNSIISSLLNDNEENQEKIILTSNHNNNNLYYNEKKKTKKHFHTKGNKIIGKKKNNLKKDDSEDYNVEEDSFYYDSSQPLDEVLRKLYEKENTLFTLDYLEYKIYLIDPSYNYYCNEDYKINYRENEIKEIYDKINKIIKEKIPENYIWQGDTFQLEISKENNNCLRNGQTIYPILKGRMNFSDSSTDEWFVTYLLTEVTKNFNVIVQLQDQDGEFLLIEAAIHLEEWMNQDPLYTKDRVFIYKGKVIILPQCPKKPSDLYYEVFPIQQPIYNIHKAIEMVVKEDLISNSNEKHSGIQDAIESRLSTFPKEAIEFGSHRIVCYLPINVIKVLNKYPQLVSKAIYYLVHRNPKANKYLNTCERFFPKSEDNIRDEFAHVSVNVNRCQYVQLISQKIEPIPSKLFNIYKESDRRTERQQAAYDLGLKILCGMEMFYQIEKSEIPIDTIIENSTVTINEVRKRKCVADSDDWLDNAYYEMEKYLLQKSSKPITNSNKQSGEVETKAKELLSGIKSFMEKESSFEGIENNKERRFDKLLEQSFGGLSLKDLLEGEEEMDLPTGSEEDDFEMDEEMIKLMEEMDEELQDLNVEDREQDDKTVMANLLKSFKEQGYYSEYGPTSVLFEQMGIELPEDEEE